jgi:hypothetical protein
MFRIDTPHKAPTKPVPLPSGTGGYFQDTNPAGGTEVSADWLNHVQEEIAAVIEACGMTLDKTDDTLLAQAVAGAAALKAHTTDTGTVTTRYLRAVLAADASRATGLNSLVAASEGSTATGRDSAVIAGSGDATGARAAVLGAGGNSQATGDDAVVLASFGALATGDQAAAIASAGGAASGAHSAVIATSNTAEFTEATGADSAAIAVAGAVASGAQAVVLAAMNSEAAGEQSLARAGKGNVVTGARSAVLGGKNSELHDDDTIGGGAGTSGITKANANQNLTWKIKNSTGNAHFKNNLRVGGDPCNDVTGTFEVNYLGQFTTGINLPTGANAVAERHVLTGINILPGTGHIYAIGNSRIGANSLVLWSFESAATVLLQGFARVTAGQVEVVFHNPASGAVTDDITVNYIIVNPVA